MQKCLDGQRGMPLSVASSSMTALVTSASLFGDSDISDIGNGLFDEITALSGRDKVPNCNST